LDKADNVEPNYTDGSTCTQQAENETCEVQRDRVVTYIGMPERSNAYILTKNQSNCLKSFVCAYVYSNLNNILQCYYNNNQDNE
jgi:hypothetical protein